MLTPASCAVALTVAFCAAAAGVVLPTDTDTDTVAFCTEMPLNERALGIVPVFLT